MKGLRSDSFGPGARRLAGVCGWVVAALGALVLLGWAVDSDAITRVVPGMPQTRPLTAVGMVLIGAALVLLAPAEDPGPRHRVGVVLAALATALGAAVLLEQLFGGFGIDDLFVGAGPESPRPSSLTAIDLAVCGLALVTVDRDPPRHRPAAILVPLLGLAVLATLVGYAYDVKYLRGSATTPGVALPTAVALGLAVTAIVLCRPDRGIVAFLRGDDPASTLARRLVPLAILLPLLLGAVRIAAEDLGLFNEHVGLALTTLASILIVIAVIVVSVRGVRVESAGRDLSESSFRAVTEASIEGIVSMDRSGRVTYFNPAAERIFGHGSAELLGRPVTVLTPERFRPAHETDLRMFLETGERRLIGQTAELVGLRRDGTEFPISVSLVDWEADGRMYFTATIRDITRQQVADRARVESERVRAAERRQFADAQQIASVGSWELNLATGERIWSAQHYRNHGFEPAEAPPDFDRLVERLHPEDRDLARERMEQILAGERELSFSYRVVLGDGRIREIEVEGRPLIDADGSTRVLGTSRDVTAERDAERLKDDFFGLVSHELRTPLTSIIGYAELLAEVEGENLSEQGRRFLEVVERNSRRELSLVGDLLLLTRITAGTFEIELGKADLTELARTTLEATQPVAEKAGVDLALDAPEPLVVDGDPHRLAQVVENLVSNAIKFTPSGGSVAVRVERADGAVALEVSDTGIGIEEEDLGRLFDRMYRADEAERRHIQGTGLGLTIVKAIVDAHEATIAVSSEPGVGTTFRVELPLRSAVEPHEYRAPVRDRPRHGRAEGRPVGAEGD